MSIESIQKTKIIKGITITVMKEGPDAARLRYWDKELSTILDKIESCLKEREQ